MKFLVVGGKGNLGFGCVKTLQERNIESLVCDAPESLFELSQHYIYENKIDAILNFSVLVDSKSCNISIERQDYQVNVSGLQHLLNLSQSLNVPLIHFSTREVIGVRDFRNHSAESSSLRLIGPDEPMLPMNSYGMTKLIGEFMLRGNKSSAVIRLNTCYTDDWRSGRGLISTLVKKSREIGEITLDNHGEAIRDPIHIQDVTNLVLKILKKRAFGELFHVGGGQQNYLTLKDICKLANPRVKIVLGKSNLDYGFLMDISNARGLGWEPSILFKNWITVNK